METNDKENIIKSRDLPLNTLHHFIYGMRRMRTFFKNSICFCLIDALDLLENVRRNSLPGKNWCLENVELSSKRYGKNTWAKLITGKKFMVDVLPSDFCLFCSFLLWFAFLFLSKIALFHTFTLHLHISQYL